MKNKWAERSDLSGATIHPKDLRLTRLLIFIPSAKFFPIIFLQFMAGRHDHRITIFLQAVVVVQLVERTLPIPEVHGLNPVISKLLYGTFVYCQLYWKDENKEKEAGNVPLFRRWNIFPSTYEAIWGKTLSVQCLRKKKKQTNAAVVLLLCCLTIWINGTAQRSKIKLN